MLLKIWKLQDQLEQSELTYTDIKLMILAS